jgi:hypothetical protein
MQSISTIRSMIFTIVFFEIIFEKKEGKQLRLDVYFFRVFAGIQGERGCFHC